MIAATPNYLENILHLPELQIIRGIFIPPVKNFVSGLSSVFLYVIRFPPAYHARHCLHRTFNKFFRK